MLSLEIHLEYRSFFYCAELWRLLASTHPELAEESVNEAYAEKQLPFRAIEQLLNSRKGRKAFGVQWRGGEISGPYNNANSRVTRLSLAKVVLDEDDAKTWLAPLLDDKRFVQARLFDPEYDFWQNAKDPVQYDTRGRSYAGLPTKSNGLSYPMERTIVDTDANPGRWRFRHGYIESIGSVMWLGPEFFIATGARERAIVERDWLQTERIGDVLMVKAWPTSFTSAAGEEAVVQDKLRALLYPRDVGSVGA